MVSSHGFFHGPLGPSSRHRGAHGTRRFHGHRDAWQLIQPFEEQIAPSDENRLGRWCAMPASYGPSYVRVGL